MNLDESKSTHSDNMGEDGVTMGRKPGLVVSLIPLVALVFFLYMQLQVFGLEDPHLAILGGAAVAALMGIILGFKWKTIEDGIVEGIQVGMNAILILMVVGILIATWIASGVVPYLIDLGLGLLHPSIFYVASCAICAVVSLATGSSWTTAGTVGVALMGIASGLGMSEAVAAGAIVSGAYFGDKLSPMSDSTNLAPAVVGVELFTHIRHMLYTTLPAIIISLIIYGFMGLLAENKSGDVERITAIRDVLQSEFKLGPVLLLAPAMVLVMVWRKFPALPSLFLASVFGGILGIAIQGSAISELIQSAFVGYSGESGNSEVDDLLNKGGMDGMMWTVSLILCALGFGGVMMKTYMLETIALSILRFATNTVKLVAATNISCVLMNLIASDQYLAIAVPGKMFRKAFEKAGLAPQNLSRCLEDAGTLTSPLVFWNTCGATMTKFLGVSPLAYGPFAFFNWISVLISIILAATGIGMKELEKKESNDDGTTQTPTA